MRTRFFIGVMFVVFTTAGCARNTGFDFPENGDRVMVKVKLQEDLKLRPMKAIYRSSICTDTGYNSNLEPYDYDGYNNIVKSADQVDEGGVHFATFEVDGGGECQWRLSNLTFGVQYKTPERFGSGFLVVGAGGVIVAFDDNAPPLSMRSKIVEGDLEIEQDYYLWVRDRIDRKPRMTVGLFKDEGLSLSYKAKDARVIYFEPSLHSNYVAYSSMREGKSKGYTTLISYPDGSVVEARNGPPDFKKMECIRLPSECQK